MLGTAKAFSGFSVDDIAAAKDFYGDILGLDVGEENGMLVLHISGGGDVLVYPKPDHEPASFTILNFPVGDVEANDVGDEVAMLRDPWGIPVQLVRRRERMIGVRS